MNPLRSLSGAIVMTRPILTDFIRADRAPASGDLRRATTGQSPNNSQRNQQITAMLNKEHPGVTLEPSDGEHGTVFVGGLRDMGLDGYPSVVLAA